MPAQACKVSLRRPTPPNGRAAEDDKGLAVSKAMAEAYEGDWDGTLRYVMGGEGAAYHSGHPCRYCAARAGVSAAAGIPRDYPAVGARASTRAGASIGDAPGRQLVGPLLRHSGAG